MTYGILRARGEFLDYRDRERDLSFSASKGEIDTFESTIGRMLTVALNRDEANADADLITLTLLLPRISLEDQGTAFETLAAATLQGAVAERDGEPSRLTMRPAATLEGRWRCTCCWVIRKILAA